MLSIAEMEMKNLNPKIRVELFGQELNPESFAICKSDMLVTGHNPENIAYGSSHPNQTAGFQRNLIGKPTNGGT
jgi:type I restriction enzyme M protein